jgi:hemolysin activation/secretion protein
MVLGALRIGNRWLPPAASLLVLLTIFSASAQQNVPADRPPPSREGSDVERRLPPTAPARPAPSAPVLAPAPAPAPPEAPETFIVAAIVIEGATIFEPAAFVPLYRDLLARPVDRRALAALAEDITALYYDAGYTLSRAYIPPQDIEAGVITVRIAEGYIERVVFEGAAGHGSLLQSYAAPIAAERPLRRATLERQLLLMGDLFGARVADARLRPLDVAEGRYELVVDLQHKPYDVYTSLDNRGTRSNGPLQLWGSAGANALGDSSWRAQGAFFTAPNTPRELLYGQVGLSRIVGSQGTVLRTTVSASRNIAGPPQKSSDTEAASRRFLVGATHPVVRSRTQSLWGSFNFDALHSKEDRFQRTSFEDELRVLRPSLYYYLSDDLRGETGINLEASLGLNALGASPNGPERSRADADTSFRKLRLDAWRNQGLFGPWSLYGQAAGQISDHALLSSEEFSLGGARFGRGYESGLISGDRGAAGSVELRFTEPLTGIANEYQLYGFYDVGRISNGSVDNDARHRLASTGLGGRLTIEPALRLNLELAKPLNPVEGREDRDWRAFFTIAAEF